MDGEVQTNQEKRDNFFLNSPDPKGRVSLAIAIIWHPSLSSSVNFYILIPFFKTTWLILNKLGRNVTWVILNIYRIFGIWKSNMADRTNYAF